jgi:hypothetical protein
VPVKYLLQPNGLIKNEPDQYRAIVVFDETLELEDVIDTMEFRSSSFTKADMLGVIDDYHRTLRRLICDGNKVNTGLIVMELTIKGNFDGRDASFDGKNGNAIKLNIRPVSEFETELQQKAQLKKLPSTEPTPIIDFYRNLDKNGESNTTLTPTHMSRLKGYKLKFDESDPRQGVFLLPQAVDGILSDPNPIRVEHYSRITRSEIIFRVPDDLSPGDYKLEVRALFGKEDVRTGTYKQILQVL